eukprot:2866265-Heterocapsa_arctica.AAC.1
MLRPQVLFFVVGGGATLPGAPAIGFGGAAGAAAGGAGSGARCCAYSNNAERQSTHTKPLQ